MIEGRGEFVTTTGKVDKKKKAAEKFGGLRDWGARCLIGRIDQRPDSLRSISKSLSRISASPSESDRGLS